MGSLPSRLEVIFVVIGWLVVTYVSTQLIAVSLLVLWFIWKLLVVRGMPPVLPMALSFQWFQTVGGLIYCEVFDRRLPTLALPQHELMVTLGLIAITLTAVGVFVGAWIVGVREYPINAPSVLPWHVLLTVYVVLTLFEGSINQFAWQYPLLTQAILAVSVIRLGVVFLIMRRLLVPELRRMPVAALLTLEVALGFTGFFASFREPIAISAMVFYQYFNWRRVEHVMAMVVLVLVAGTTAIVWMGVRVQFRAEQVENTVLAQSRSARFSRVADLVGAWFQRGGGSEVMYDADFFVDRMWAVYYPALALARVPNAVPHTDGRFVVGALRHIATPRVLFPDKPELASDSDKVREFSGVWVAGRDEGTSIAFGYAIEAYVDYGIPMMFIPIAAYALLMGTAFALFSRWIQTPEFGVPLLVVTFWLSLYLFEKSWAKMLGDNLTTFVYLGGVVFILERLVRSKYLGDSGGTLVEAQGPQVELYPASLQSAASRLSPRER
jgi:hypothetical protein